MQDGTERNLKHKIGFFVTKGVWGGAQKYVYNLVTSLPKGDFDVFVVVGAGKILKEKLEAKGVRVYEIENLKRDISIASEIKSFTSVFKIIKKEKPDTLHLNSPKAAGLGSVAGRLLGVPNIIQTVHGFTWNEDRGEGKKKLITFVTKLTMSLCHKTIVLAKKELKEAVKSGAEEAKLVLIPNGIEPIQFKDMVEARRGLLARIGKVESGNEIWFGTIAELHKNKGLEYAVTALSEVKTPFLFFIIGNGEEKTRLEKLVKDKNLENQVFFVGFIEGAVSDLTAFDIFLLPSIKEGLPFALLEAGLAGLPVITTSIGGIPDVIENNVTGSLVKPKDAKALQRAIEFMIKIPEERKTMGLKLKEKVETEFSLENMLQKTFALYK